MQKIAAGKFHSSPSAARSDGDGYEKISPFPEIAEVAMSPIGTERRAKALFAPCQSVISSPLLHAHDLRREGSHGNPHPTARIHINPGRRSSRVPVRGA